MQISCLQIFRKIQVRIISEIQSKIILEKFLKFECANSKTVGNGLKALAINTSSEKQLEEFAQKIGAKIKKGDTFFLFGEMGVGKTSFVKEMFDKAMEYAIPHGVTMDEYREYLQSKPEDYPKGSQDQDIFRYIEPKFYPRIKVDYQNLMAYRS